jgi:hypothetical protein
MPTVAANPIQDTHEYTKPATPAFCIIADITNVPANPATSAETTSNNIEFSFNHQGAIIKSSTNTNLNSHSAQPIGTRSRCRNSRNTDKAGYNSPVVR